LKIETSGFDNNDIALLQVTQYARQKPVVQLNFHLVETDPQSILSVRVTTEQMKSWEEIDEAAVRYNALLRRGNEVVDRSIDRIPVRGGLAGAVKEAGKGLLRVNVETRLRPERYTMQKWRATVRMTMYDAKTRKVSATSIGYSVITVRILREYGHEPMVFLHEGNLDMLGIAKGENLDGQMRHLLQISAFIKADMPENNIVADAQ
jgi:hypothetical protein